MTASRVDMKSYDVYHIGISGGKDSQALLLWAKHESGLPHDKLHASFCDTGNEHDLTYAHIKMMADTIHPITTIKPPLDFYELAKKKGRFPSTKARFCTQQLKIYPTQKHVMQFQQDNKEVVLLSGVRAGESAARAALPELEWDEYYACDMYRPLLQWSVDDVWAILAKYNSQRNPLYEYGARRVGCFPCIMSNKLELRTIAKHFPERIDMIRKAELETGKNGSTFFSRNKTPAQFRSLTITNKAGEQMLVPTIDDVVQWSKTGSYRPRQYEMDLDDLAQCSSNLGACE